MNVVDWTEVVQLHFHFSRRLIMFGTASDVASSSDDALAARRLLLTEKWAARNPEDARRYQEQMERRQTAQAAELSEDTAPTSVTQHDGGRRTNSGSLDTLPSNDNEAAI